MMVSDPERFIEEKLQKRFLSINTVRDALLASMIIALQRSEEARNGQKLDETLRISLAAELRKKMVEICEAEKIPTEYPTLDQLRRLRAKLEEAFGINRLDPPILDAHRRRCDQLFAKGEE
jgi:hypothetical protein